MGHHAPTNGGGANLIGCLGVAGAHAALVRQALPVWAELITDWIVGSPILFRGEVQGQAWLDNGVVLEFTLVVSGPSSAGPRRLETAGKIVRYPVAETRQQGKDQRHDNRGLAPVRGSR